MKKSIAGKTGGFTVMELLVIIAIIAVLVCLLLPSLKSAREKSHSSCCNCNLKQLLLAIAQYSPDYSNRMPAMGVAYSATTGVFSTFALASNYLGSATILVCPSDAYKSVASPWAAGNDLNNCSYAYQGAGSGVVPTNMIFQADPNDIIIWDRGVTGCTAGAGYGSATFGVGSPWLPNSPHKGRGGNIGFNDGHVEWKTRMPTNATLGCMNPS